MGLTVKASVRFLMLTASAGFGVVSLLLPGLKKKMFSAILLGLQVHLVYIFNINVCTKE